MILEKQKNYKKLNLNLLKMEKINSNILNSDTLIIISLLNVVI